jgi:AGZA family xanthine/uracil permease-like MFS transporter
MSKQGQTSNNAIARYFEFDALGTNFRREIIAGLTTFLAMAYILVVNPLTLKNAGMNFNDVFMATAIASIIGTLVMGLYAKYPLALAPGMGLNAFFAYTVVLGMGIPYQQALAGVFVSGVFFLILAISGYREMIINAIPSGLKHAAAAGIGLFIAFIGFKEAGIIVANPATFVGLGKFTDHNVQLAIFGIVVTALLLARKVSGAIFYGILLTTIAGMVTGLIDLPSKVFSLPPAAGAFGDFWKPFTDFHTLFSSKMLIVIFTFLFVDFFDNAGTLFGVAQQAGLVKEDKLPRAGRAMTADSVASITGAVMGTSTVTSYIESSAGVAAGGRSGFTAVVVAICFALSMFFSPVLSVITAQVTAAALIMVGVLMASSLGKIEWDKLEESIPAFLTIITMPLTFSIATGIALGFIVYPLTKIVNGEGKKVHPVMYAMFVVFLIYFIWLRE